MAASMVSNKPMLNKGQQIMTSDHMKYTIVDFLGRGGQGEVYKVKGTDGEYALKWYHPDAFLAKINSDAFYNNICNNVSQGVPTLSSGDAATAFIWPTKLVDKQLGSFGYLMPLFRKGYSSLSDVIMGRHLKENGAEEKLDWPSWFIRVTAGLNLVRAFEILHASGLSYQDMNEGGFAINMQNGDVMICDCDNVAPDLQNLGILGVLPYMAPEVARGEQRPNQLTDRHSLAVVLFRLFLNNHPLEGTRSITLHGDEHLSRREADMRIYGTEPFYCLDTKGEDNPPDKQRHADVRKLCNIYPVALMQAFQTVFTEGLKDPSKRLSANEWRKVLLQVRDCLVQVNGTEMFCYTPLSKELPEACRKLTYPNGHVVLCMPNKILYAYHAKEYCADYKTGVGKIVATKNPQVLGLYNGTGMDITMVWHGQSKTCPDRSYMPLIPESELHIGKLKIRVD